MSTHYADLIGRLKEISDISFASALLEWDQQTYMPVKGNDARARQMSVLAAIAHERLCRPELGELLERCEADTDLDPLQKALVREARRDRDRAVKVPEDLVREITETSGKAHMVWVEAREKSDFSLFAPWLVKLVELKKKEAEAVGYPADGCSYDALLDEYEPGATVKRLDPIIERTRDIAATAIRAITGSKRKPLTEILKRDYGVEKQKRFCMMLLERLGFDLEAGRLDGSVHPFTTSFDIRDVRITTRYNKNWLPASMFGTVHECGHALYEQGLPYDHAGTPLAEAVSLGVHESQSRFWENQIGRSMAFWKCFFGELKSIFPVQLADVNLDGFHFAVNTVEPSMIRVEADEVTYNLHIVVRYEMERTIFEESPEVDALPDLWNQKMEAYLGLKPKDDAEGILQDIHWSFAAFGYFPTYLLGNLYAAQWMAALKKAMPDLEDRVRSGEFSPILEWLRDRIHRHGRRYRAHELAENVSGEPLNPDHFGRYLKEKYGPLYDVNW